MAHTRVDRQTGRTHLDGPLWVRRGRRARLERCHNRCPRSPARSRLHGHFPRRGHSPADPQPAGRQGPGRLGRAVTRSRPSSPGIPQNNLPCCSPPAEFTPPPPARWTQPGSPNSPPPARNWSRPSDETCHENPGFDGVVVQRSGRIPPIRRTFPASGVSGNWVFTCPRDGAPTAKPPGVTRNSSV